MSPQIDEISISRTSEQVNEARRSDAPSLWTAVLWFSLLLIAAYAAVIHGLIGSWSDERIDMGHGFLVPFAAGYIAWERRDRIAAAEWRPSVWGFAFVLAAFGISIIAAPAKWLFAGRAAFLLALAGMVLCLGGRKLLRILAVPLLVLLFMIPPPTFIYDRITTPLQYIASGMAESILESLGRSVLREGNILQLVGQRLSVSEACSGIRSLTTLLFFCVFYNYLFVPRTALKWFLALSVIPVALIGNASRIVLTGVVGEFNPELAHGVFHAASGYVIVTLCGIAMLFLHLAVSRFFPPRIERNASVS